MSKAKESCQPVAKQSKAGNTSSYTGNSVLNRTIINSPPSEGKLRGFHRETLAEAERNIPGLTVESAALVLRSRGFEVW